MAFHVYVNVSPHNNIVIFLRSFVEEVFFSYYDWENSCCLIWFLCSLQVSECTSGLKIWVYGCKRVYIKWDFSEWFVLVESIILCYN